MILKIFILSTKIIDFAEYIEISDITGSKDEMIKSIYKNAEITVSTGLLESTEISESTELMEYEEIINLTDK